MRSFSVISELTGVTSNVVASEVTLTAPSVVKLQLERSDIASITRSGQDMVIKLHSGETLTIRNFYVENPQGTNQLVLEDSQGALWWVQDTAGEFHFQQIENIDAFMIAEAESDGGAIWPWVLGGVAAAAGIGIAAGSGGGGGGGGGGGDSDSSPDDGNSGVGNGNGGGSGGVGSTDTTPPTAPTNLAVSPDGTTLTGQAEPGSTIEVKGPNGIVIGKGTADSDGNFSITLDTPQISGEQLTVNATDTAGNAGPAADVTAPVVNLPDTPVILSALNDLGSAPYTIGNNQTTNDNTPQLTGTGSAGSTVRIFENGNNIGTAIVGSDGTWSFAITTALADGSHSFTAISVNIKGQSAESTQFTLTIDTTAPDAPQLSAVTDDVGSLTGALNSDLPTDDATPTFTGKGEAGATVTLYDGPTQLGTVIVDPSGNWSFTPSQPLSEGQHTIRITQTDNAGNVSNDTFSPTFTVDTTPPASPIITDVAENGATVTGTAEAGTTVSIYDDNNTLLGTTVVGSDGVFSITLNPAQTQGQSLEARIQDAAGNVGNPTDFDASDSGVPVQPIIVSVADDVAPSIGNIVNSGDTNDNTPTLSGTAEPNATINISDNGTPLLPPVTADSTGNWTFTPQQPLGDGDHNFTATATNDAGTSAPSTSFTLNVDTQLPTLSDLEVVNQGETLTGMTEAGSTVVVKDSQGTQLGTGTADENGEFTITLTPPKTNGESLIVSVTDQASNEGIAETITAPDITAPDKPVISQVSDDIPGPVGAIINGGTTNDAQPTLTGTAEVGSTVTVYDNGILLGTADIDGSGNWSFTPDSALSEGSHQLTVTSTDSSGNASTSDPWNIVVDTVAPPVPSITLVNDDAPGILGPIAQAGLTNDSTPTVSGTAQPSSVVHLFDNGNFVTDITVTPSGTWSYTFEAPLTGPNHSLTVNASDEYGNTSGSSGSWDFTLDTATPTVPSLSVSTSGNAPIDLNAQTNETRPILSGTGDIGSVITLYDNGTEIGQITVGEDGTWEFTPPLALVDGAHALTATATDPAGNVSNPASFAINVDATAPDAPLIVSATIEGAGGDVVLANGSTTSETEPLLSGNAEANAVITLYDNGDFLATVTADDNGAWSYMPGTALGEGLHVFTATATDQVGNTSPTSGGFSVVIDLTDPTTPAAPLVTDNVDPVVGNIANNGSTNDTTPTFSGTGEVGSTITLYNGSDILATATVDDSGNWSWTPTDALPVADYVITTTETDVAGNISERSPTVNFTIDTQAPDAPVISYAQDDVGASIGQITTGGTTDDNTPVLFGTAEIGSTVSIFNGGTLVGTAVADNSGNWSLALDTLPDSTYTFTAIATDKAGNPGGTSTSFTLTVNTTVLLPPQVEQIIDNVGVITGTLTDGMYTDDQILVISGSGQSGTTVVIYDNGVELGTTTVTDGQWTFTTPQLSADPLTETQHSFTFTSRDDTTETAPTAPIVITVDIVAPGVPGVDVVSPDGTIVSGTAESNSTVIIKDSGGNTIGQGQADAGGAFTVTLSPAQTGGQTLTAIAQDQAGNQSPGVDFTASNSGLPDVPVITQFLDDVGPLTDALAPGGSTDDTTPTLNGTADANVTVNIFIDGNPVAAGTATADADGNWTFTVPSDLAEGTHNFTVSATNQVGTGALSSPATLTVDLTAPLAPIILNAADDVSAITGIIANGQLTNDARPTLNGTGEANATITIFDNDVNIGTTVADSNGDWSFTPTTDLSSTLHDFTVTATDAAGYTGPESAAFTLNIDAVAPNVPVITTVMNDNGTLPVAIPQGGATNDTQPLLSGTGEIGSTITVYDNGTSLGTVTVDGNGNWSFPVNTALTAGNHNLTVTATDPAGNSSAPSAAFPIIIDIAPPTVPTLLSVTDDQVGITGPLITGQLTNDTTPTLSGRGEVGATISVFSDGNLIGTTTVDGAGVWTVTPTTPLTSGIHQLTVNQTDPAGNVSASTSGFTVNVDANAPVAPIITSVADNTVPVIGVVPNGGSTNETRPAISGTGEAGTTITLYNGETVLGTTTVNTAGNWTFTPTTALTSGTWNITATATDAAGNTGPASDIRAFTVDTLAPTTPTISTVFDDQGSITGNLTSGALTDDTLPVVSGTSEANATVKIYDGGNLVATETADGTGAWNWTPASALAQGNHVLTVTATDAAGNVSAVSNSVNFVVDSQAPVTPVITTIIDDVPNIIGAVGNGLPTNDTLPTLNGTAEANSTVSIYDNGTLITTVTANASGVWTWTPPAALNQGTHSYTVTSGDAAGNVSATSTPAVIVVDTVAPDAPTVAISADGSTLSGQAEANSTITITRPGASTLTTTAGSDGNWTLELPVRQIEGQVLTATATDAAGNTSGAGSVTAPILPLAANDNVINLELTSTTTTSTESLTDNGLLLIGALGNVASVLGDDTAQVTFNIDAGGSSDVTIDATATGIVLSLLSTLEIVVQKFDTTSGSWQTFINTSEPDFANLLTLTGSGVTLSLTGLTGGQYRVLTYNSNTLAVGSLTSLDVDVQKTSAGEVSGSTTYDGNVITETDNIGGLDTAPSGTIVTQVANANGVMTSVGAGGADIVGLYGTLHINQDGSYTYTLTDTSAAVLGHKESFTYTISHNGVSDSALLVVTLGPVAPPSTVVATDESQPLVFDTDATVVDNNTADQSGFTLLGVGLGNVLTLDVLASIENPIKFSVEDGSMRVMTLQSSAGGLLLVASYDLYIYRFNDLIQQYEQYRTVENWLEVPLLGGTSDPLTLALPAGEYVFLLNAADGISAVTGYTLSFLEDQTYTVDSLTASMTGNVLNNDVLPAGALLTEVNDVAVASTGITTINGRYGTLTIDAQGNYTYTLNSGIGADGINTPDSFIYTVKATNGDTDTASLNITPTPHAPDAVNDTSSVMAVSATQNTAVYSDTSVGSAQWTNPLIGSGSGSGSGSFTVNANSLLHDATLHFDIASALALTSLTGTWIIKLNGVAIQNGIYSGSTTNVRIDDLGAGNYTLEFTGSSSGISIGTYTVTPSVTGTTVNLDNFITNSSSTVQGNIFDGSESSGVTDQLASLHTTLNITGAGSSSATLDPLGNASSATVQGQYGTLKFNLDGSYTYTLNNGVTLSSMSNKETFTYTLNDQNGHTDTATLTIDMNPQMTSTSQIDVLTGSAYGDTLIYNLLNSSNATGGNGNDEWTNFNLAQGDKIDLRELLTGWDQQTSTLGNFIQVSTSGANTVISVDRDGTGVTYNSTPIITLDNVQTSLTELISQNHIITG